MKKFLLLLLSISMLAACGTYKPLYHVDISGDADGQVAVTFPDGQFALHGDADLAFYYGNDSTLVSYGAPVSATGLEIAPLTLEQGYAHKDHRVRECANHARIYTNDIKAAADSAGGTYYLVVDALFKEPVTGTEIHTHKVLTNRE